MYAYAVTNQEFSPGAFRAANRILLAQTKAIGSESPSPGGEQAGALSWGVAPDRRGEA